MLAIEEGSVVVRFLLKPSATGLTHGVYESRGGFES
jgi:hypothetical protein